MNKKCCFMSWVRMRLIFAAVLTCVAGFGVVGHAEEIVLWQDGFDDIDLFWEDWHVEGGLWSIGAQYNDAPELADGEPVVGTVLSGDVPSGRTAHLVRHIPLLVPGTDEFPTLKIRHWFQLGTSGTAFVGFRTATETIALASYENASGGWTDALIDLASISGMSGELVFTIKSRSNQSPGWFLNSVSLVSVISNFDGSEDFEGDTSGWFADNGQWEIGSAKLVPDPDSDSQSPGSFAGTNLSGSFSPNTVSTLFSPEFRIPEILDHPVIRFWTYFEFGKDAVGEVIVASSTEPDVFEVLHTFKGISRQWFPIELSLAKFSGKTNRLGFRLRSGASPYLGWYFDDLSLLGEDVLSKFSGSIEAGWGRWHTNGGFWQVSPFGASSDPATKKTGLSMADFTLPQIQAFPSDGVRSTLSSPPFVAPSTRSKLRLHYYNDSEYGKYFVRLVSGVSDIVDSGDYQEMPRSKLRWLDFDFPIINPSGEFLRLQVLHSHVADIFQPTYFYDDYQKNSQWELEGRWTIGNRYPTWLEFGEGQSSITPHLKGNFLSVFGVKSNSISKAISEEFKISKHVQQLKVSFKYGAFFVSSANDTFTVSYRAGNNSSWNNLATHQKSSGWRNASFFIDNSENIGTLQFRFQLVTDGQGYTHGCFIDDFKLETTISQEIYNNTFSISNIEILPLSTEMLNIESFESDLTGWTQERPGWSQEALSSGSFSPHSGSYVLGTDSKAGYLGNHTSIIASPPFIVPPTSTRPALRFFHWYQIASGDVGRLFIRQAGHLDDNVYSVSPGTSLGQWENVYVDLSKFSGKSVQLVFEMQADDDGQEDLGWFIDDLRLQTSILGSVKDISLAEGETVNTLISKSNTNYQLKVEVNEVSDPDGNPIDPAPGIDNLFVDSDLGLLNWVPTEEQGGYQYDLRLGLHDSESYWNPIDYEDFTITVREVNEAPQISKAVDISFGLEKNVLFEIVAEDPDIPAQRLTYTLEQGPRNAGVDSSTGEGGWLIAEEDRNSIQTFTVRVTDDGDPPLSDTITFRAIPEALLGPGLSTPPRLENGSMVLQYSRMEIGTLYRLQSVDSLADPIQWEDVRIVSWDAEPFTLVIELDSIPHRFFRLTTEE